jgi:hypothetical protein
VIAACRDDRPTSAKHRSKSGPPEIENHNAKQTLVRPGEPHLLRMEWRTMGATTTPSALASASQSCGLGRGRVSPWELFSLTTRVSIRPSTYSSAPRRHGSRSPRTFPNTRSMWWPIPHRFFPRSEIHRGGWPRSHYGNASINTDPPMGFYEAGAIADKPARCDRNSIRISRRQKEAISLAMCR